MYEPSPSKRHTLPSALERSAAVKTAELMEMVAVASSVAKLSSLTVKVTV